MLCYRASRRDSAKGSSRKFQPSLNGSSARQTNGISVTRVGELSVTVYETRDHLEHHRPTYTHTAQPYDMSILSQPIMRGVQIMPSSRAARSTGSQCHHAHSIDPCRARTVGNGKASNHADTMHTTRMEAAGSWAARATRSRYTGTSAHRASSSAKRDLQLITYTSRSPQMPVIAPRR